MHCPDCGHILTPIPLGINGEAKDSYRCYRCGGFWLESWLANRVNSKVLDKWPNVGGAHGVANNGNDSCPVHPHMKLDRYEGDSVPQNLTVKRCRLCNWWWFPHNTIFQFKPAQEAKVHYYRLWGMPADLKGLMLPVLSLLVLVSGGVVALQLVRQQQFAQLNASGVAADVLISYLGDGRVSISFRSLIDISEIEFKNKSALNWQKVGVALTNDLYGVEVTGLNVNQVYQVRILGKIYEFTTY
jgi:hypothetical protein